MKFAYNYCCSSYELTPAGWHRYHELATEKGCPPVTDLFRLGIDPIYIQVLEEMDNAAPSCQPDIFEIADHLVQASGINLATEEYPGAELYRLLEQDLEDSSVSPLEFTPLEPTPELPPLTGTPQILTPEDTLTYRSRGSKLI